MSSRAIIAYTRGNGEWTGVWNHWSSHTQYLGAEIIKRIALLDGDLPHFCRRWIDGCHEGWSDFSKGERTQDGGVWRGTHVNGRVTFDGGTFPDASRDCKGLPDAHYLYLLDLSDRRLSVFEVAAGPCSPFAACVFDARGEADPPQLPPVPQ